MIQLILVLICALIGVGASAGASSPLNELQELLQEEMARSKQNPRSFWSQGVLCRVRSLKDEALMIPNHKEWVHEYNKLLEQLAELPRAPLLIYLPIGIRPLLSPAQLKELRLPNIRQEKEKSLLLSLQLKTTK